MGKKVKTEANVREKVQAKKDKGGKRSFSELLKQAPIKKKLTISHGSIIVSTFLLIVVLLVSMMGIQGYVKDMYSGPVTNSYYIGDIRYALADIPRAINYARAECVLINADVDGITEEVKQDVDHAREMLQDAHEVLSESLLTEESKTQLAAIYAHIQKLEGELNTTMGLLLSKRIESAGYYYMENVKPVIDQIRIEVEELDQSVYAVSRDYTARSTRIAVIMLVIGIVVLILVTVGAVAITRRVTKVIAEPVDEITKAAKLMRQGDMKAHREIQYQSEDELGVLAEAMRGTMITLGDYIEEISTVLSQMAKGDLTKNFSEITDFLGDFSTIKESFMYILKEFNKTLTSIRMVSEQVDKGSDDIATSANELAASTEQQASSVEELTATIGTVSNIAIENARQADLEYSGIMQSVHDAEREREQVQALQDEMQRIKEISRKIEAIITAIEEIADQTSLLSLNASIEAARAGEAGRGFAVVADQIGKLATDSAQAAVNTKELIGRTVAEIEKGDAITKSTAVAFENIIKEMNSFAETAKGSSKTAMEQADILKQVEGGISQIAGATQENAASAEESLATSEELAARATELAEQVDKFKLYQA